METMLERIHSILIDTARETSRKRKPPRRKSIWSPAIATAATLSKKAHHAWKICPSKETMEERKRANKALRSTQRRAVTEARTDYLQSIMDASPNDQKLFHSLIRRQRGRPRPPPDDIIFPDLDKPDEHDVPANTWANYFEDLATPHDNPNFDADHHRSTELQLLLLEHIQSRALSHCEVTHETVRSALRRLKQGKAPDAFGITSEHLLAADEMLADTLSVLFTSIVSKGVIPVSLKTGLVHPIPKKGKNPKRPDSYRRITVTSIIGKLLELIIMDPLKATLAPSQSSQQRGFTDSSSSNMAALLLTEAMAETKDLGRPLYITFLDATKAFDVTWHASVFTKIARRGIDGNMWCVLRDWYVDIASHVSWKGDISRVFSELQGVRQGGIHSVEQYKAHTNDSLTLLEEQNTGFHIGSCFVGAPTCADDTALLSDTVHGLQLLNSIMLGEANRDRYLFSDAKTKIQVHNSKIPPMLWNEVTPWTMAGKSIDVVDKHDHLGLTRCCTTIASDHLTRARLRTGIQTSCALFGAGFHGSNGLSPIMCLKLWDTYITPRMTFGLEAIVIPTKMVQALDTYQYNTLRQLQHLPRGTSKAAVHLLLGVLPMEGHLDKKTLSLFGHVARNVSTSEHEVVHRQLALKDHSSASWTTHVRKLLSRYSLPSAYEIMARPPSKPQWKKSVKRALEDFWTEKLRSDAAEQSSMRYLNLKVCVVGSPHHVWSHAAANPSTRIVQQ